MDEHTEIVQKITSLLKENKDKEKIRVSIQLHAKRIQADLYLKENTDYGILIQVLLIYEEDDRKKVMYKIPQLSQIAIKHIKDIRIINNYNNQ